MGRAIMARRKAFLLLRPKLAIVVLLRIGRNPPNLTNQKLVREEPATADTTAKCEVPESCLHNVSVHERWRNPGEQADGTKGKKRLTSPTDHT